MSNFKPGDWVHIPYLNSKPVQYRSDLCHLGLELWKPKPGEWCWFWNDNDEVPLLDRVYKCHSECISQYELTFVDTMKKYCEPFIGQLPTILKDK